MFWPVCPPTSTSKNTRGFSGFAGLSDGVGWDILRTRRFKTLVSANLAKPGRCGVQRKFHEEEWAHSLPLVNLQNKSALLRKYGGVSVLRGNEIKNWWITCFSFKPVKLHHMVYILYPEMSFSQHPSFYVILRAGSWGAIRLPVTLNKFHTQ